MQQPDVGRGLTPFVVRAAEHALLPIGEHLAIGSRSPIFGERDQLRTGLRIDLHVLPGVEPLDEIAPPRPEPVDPCADGVPIFTEMFDAEPPRPAIVGQRRHPGRLPDRGDDRAVIDLDGQLVVPVGEDVGLDRDDISHDPLDREPAGVDLGRHALDHHPALTVLRQRHRQLPFRSQSPRRQPIRDPPPSQPRSPLDRGRPSFDFGCHGHGGFATWPGVFALRHGHVEDSVTVAPAPLESLNESSAA
ncbi:MAG: hypothetical protein SH850_05385 [Planctomycetaceae bacterium]|nr:hypothetical protein [Planctomycetaceae bacterium]